MATKVFILANKNSANYLKNLAEKFWTKAIKGDKRKSGSKSEYGFTDAQRHFDIEVFSDYETYDQAEFKELIKINPKIHTAADKIFIWITPELFWKSTDLDEGYEHALEIINDKLTKENHILQFRFLSILPFESIKAKSRPYLRRIAEAFPFYDLIGDQERFNNLYGEYTPTHYHLIKRLAVSDTGYINKLIHDINGLINNNTPSEKKDKHMLNSISGLAYLTDDGSLKTVLEGYTFETRIGVFEKCREVLKDVWMRVSSGDETKQNLKRYNVLVVEDDPEYRESLKKILGDYFSKVQAIEPQANENFTDALKNRLPDEAVDFDIIFLDLLFEDKKGKWIEGSGLDLYKSIKTNNPYCVTPIVTSLPRAVVASLVKEIDKAGIPSHLLLSKANGENYLKLDFKDKLPDIIQTCRDNHEKKDWHESIVMPNCGLFKDNIIRTGLYDLIKDHRLQFEQKVAEAYNFYNRYKNNNNSLTDEEGWDKKLFTPKNISANKVSAGKVWDKLVTILTYRFIVISAIISNENKTIHPILGKGKNALQTNLGFNISNNKPILKNLFSHELKFKRNLENEISQVELSQTLDKTVKEWLLQLLKEGDVYENITKAGYEKNEIYDVSKSGNLEVKSDFIDDLTVKWISDFLNKIISDYNNLFAQKMAKCIVDEYDTDEVSNSSFVVQIQTLITLVYP